MPEGWDFPDPHLVEVQVAEADIDGLEHTNNAVYVNWCEQVAWDHSAALGLDLAAYRQLDRAMVITHSEFDYLQASRLGDRLQVATWIVDWDRRLTMQRRFQVRRADSGDTIMRALMDFACVAISNGKPRRLPPAFIEGYGAAIRPATN
jgi:acyl-CoA thioester hydrolase